MRTIAERETWKGLDLWTYNFPFEWVFMERGPVLEVGTGPFDPGRRTCSVTI